MINKTKEQLKDNFFSEEIDNTKGLECLRNILDDIDSRSSDFHFDYTKKELIYRSRAIGLRVIKSAQYSDLRFVRRLESKKPDVLFDDAKLKEYRKEKYHPEESFDRLLDFYDRYTERDYVFKAHMSLDKFFEELEGIRKEIRGYIYYMFYTDMLVWDSKKHSYTVPTDVKRLESSPIRFLTDYDGTMRIDYEHMLLFCFYLKSIKSKRLKEMKPILDYLALEKFYLEAIDFMRGLDGKGKEVKTFWFSKESYLFHSKSFIGYEDDCISGFLKPKDKAGYCYRPESLYQTAFIASVAKNYIKTKKEDKYELDYKVLENNIFVAIKEMSKKKKGILYKFLPKEVEEYLFPHLINYDFNPAYMDGKYADVLWKELKFRRKEFGVKDYTYKNLDLYQKMVKPCALFILGVNVQIFLRTLKDVSCLEMYYLSSNKLCFTIRNSEGLSDAECDKIIAENVSEQFKNKLKKEEKLDLIELTERLIR